MYTYMYTSVCAYMHVCTGVVTSTYTVSLTRLFLLVQGAGVRGVCDVCCQVVTTEQARVRMDDAGTRYRHEACNNQVLFVAYIHMYICMHGCKTRLPL
jgi:hypothetical protein